MPRNIRNLVALATATVLVLSACGDDESDDEAGEGGGGERLEVVAAFYPAAEAATRVGGGLVEVTNLTPAGTEPHDVELTSDQVDDLEDADLVLYLGQGFQPQVAEIAEGREGPSVDLLEGIDLEAGGSEALASEEEGHEEEEEGHEEEAEEDHEESGLDPHYWLDPQRQSDSVDAVEAALAGLVADDAETLATNAQGYKDDLATLDEEFASGLADCQRDQVVTSHAAFFYLADRYGLNQLPIAGLSPESEPDGDRLAELADQIEAEGITTVFYETLVSPDVAETLAREAGVETAVLNPLEGLTQEELDAGDDYSSIMRDNLDALTSALGCT